MIATKTMLHHTASFIVGFLTRPCCSIPAALSVLGLGGVEVAASLAPYRVWFLLMAAGFFVSSFYLNFIHNRNRAGMVVWGLSMLLAATMLPGDELVAAPATHAQPVEEKSMNTTLNITHAEIPVLGMACSACARRLQRVLSETDGVVQAQVSFDGKQARVAYDSEQVGTKQIGERIRDAGFEPDLEQAKVSKVKSP